MKKVILTIIICAISIGVFAQHYEFDTYIENSKFLGPKMDSVSCEIEDLTHHILATHNMEEHKRYAEKIYQSSKELKNQIQYYRKKATRFRVAKIIIYETANILLVCAQSAVNPGVFPDLMYHPGDELPVSKYYDYLDEISQDALRIKSAYKEEKRLQKANDILLSISNFNQYYAEGDIR